MSRLNLITNNLKNAKIDKKQLKKIYVCFSHDYTASKTANELQLSRQTINNYYKMIRDALIEEEGIINDFNLNNDFCKNCFVLKYIQVNTLIYYYIDYNNKPYLLNIKNKNLKKIFDFVKYHVKSTLINHKRANTARVLYNTYQDEYFVSSYLRSSNELNEYIKNRLKKFRGLNKTNVNVHIKESVIRFNNNETIIYNTICRIFNL